jgi:hypothetical protein
MAGTGFVAMPADISVISHFALSQDRVEAPKK